MARVHCEAMVETPRSGNDMESRARCTDLAAKLARAASAVFSAIPAIGLLCSKDSHPLAAVSPSTVADRAPRPVLPLNRGLGPYRARDRAQ